MVHPSSPRAIVLAAACGGLPVFPVVAAAAPQFEAVERVVMMEAESVELNADFVVDTQSVDGISGSALEFVAGASICNSPPKQAESYPALQYTFRIHDAGEYWLHLNMRKTIHCVDEGSDGDTCHSGAGCQSYGTQAEGYSCDEPGTCWRSDISNDFFVQLQTDTGEGVPFVGGHTGIMKLFGGKPNEYSWSPASGLDHKDAKYALAAGDYKLLVRGRSRGAKFDRVLLYEDGAFNGARNAAQSSPSETLFMGTEGEDGDGVDEEATGDSEASGGSDAGRPTGGAGDGDDSTTGGARDEGSTGEGPWSSVDGGSVPTDSALGDDIGADSPGVSAPMTARGGCSSRDAGTESGLSALAMLVVGAVFRRRAVLRRVRSR